MELHVYEIQRNINLELERSNMLFFNDQILSEEFHVSNIFNDLLQSTSKLLYKYSDPNISVNWLKEQYNNKKKIYLHYDYNINSKNIVKSDKFITQENLYHIYLQFEYNDKSIGILSTEYINDSIVIYVNFYMMRIIYSKTFTTLQGSPKNQFIKYCRIKLKHEFLHITEMYSQRYNPIQGQYNDKLLLQYINLEKYKLSEENKFLVYQVLVIMKKSEQHARINAIYEYIMSLSNDEIFQQIKSVDNYAKYGEIGKYIYCLFANEKCQEHSYMDIISLYREKIKLNKDLEYVIDDINNKMKYFNNHIIKEIKEYENNIIRILYKALSDKSYGENIDDYILENLQYNELFLFNDVNYDDNIIFLYKEYL